MIEVMFWGFVLRFVQCLLQASPFILAGLFIAGVFQRLMMYTAVKRLFGAGSYGSLLQAWGLGMLLPVCSLGVIPVIREMRKAGLAGGTILAFAMSAPLFNPLSLMYGLTLSEPLTILAFGLGSLVIVTVVGLVWDHLYPHALLEMAPQQGVPYGLRRMLSIFVFMGRAMTNWSMVYILIGLLGVAMLGALLPKTSLQRMANYDNTWAPVIMSGIAIPVYATPMLAMSQLGMMFQHANSVGAAFVLLTLGAGMNLGLLVWMWREYGWLRALSWIVFLLVVVLGIAYGIEKPLFPTNVDPADHTHAFDVYCQPFDQSVSTNFAAATYEKLNRDIAPFEWDSFYGLVGMFVIGVILKLLDRWFVIENWLERPVAGHTLQTDRYDLVMPGWALGMVSLAGLIAASVMGCYAYYPKPKDVLDEMYIVQGEALSPALSGDSVHAKYWIEVFDDWSRKLEVGVYLREYQLSDYHRMKTRLLREKLELLEHEVEDFAALLEKHPRQGREHPEVAHAREQVGHLIADVQRTFTRVKLAYLNER